MSWLTKTSAWDDLKECMKRLISVYFLSFGALAAEEPNRVSIALASVHMAQDFINDAQDNSHDYQVVEDSCFSALIFLRNAEVCLEEALRAGEIHP